MTLTLLPPVASTTPRPFLVIRIKDVSKVSGTGTIAEGTVFTDGSCAVRWRGDDPCTQNWDRGLESFLKTHGHGGLTYVVFLDDPDTKVTYPESFQRPNRGRTLKAGRSKS